MIVSPLPGIHFLMASSWYSVLLNCIIPLFWHSTLMVQVSKGSCTQQEREREEDTMRYSLGQKRGCHFHSTVTQYLMLCAFITLLYKFPSLLQINPYAYVANNFQYSSNFTVTYSTIKVFIFLSLFLKSPPSFLSLPYYKWQIAS